MIERSAAGEGELRRVVDVGMVQGGQGPTVRYAHDEASRLECAKRIAETGVIDAELFAEGGPGPWLGSTTEEGAHLLGERLGSGIVIVDLESGGLAVADDE